MKRNGIAFLERMRNMHKRDIESAELVRGGILLTAKDGRTALLRFRDSERLRSASVEQRAAFRLSL